MIIKVSASENQTKCFQQRAAAATGEIPVVLLLLFMLALLLLPDADAFQSLTPLVLSEHQRRQHLSKLDASSVNNEKNGSHQEKTKWYSCASSKELAKAVRLFGTEDDRVAELGSQLKEVSETIAEKCSSAVMVDAIRKFPKDHKIRTEAMRQHDDINKFDLSKVDFHEIHSLDEWRKALFFSEKQQQQLPPQQQNHFDMLVLDVNAIVGNDLEWTSFSIIREFLALNEAFGGFCRVVLIKSTGLNRLASRLVHGQHWIEHGGPTRSTVQPYIIATVGVQQYRQTLEWAVRPGDAVLEVGSHFGTSTVLLDKRARCNDSSMSGDGHDGDSRDGYCIGVDVGPSIIEGAKKRYPGMFFAVGDAWKTADLLRIQRSFLENNPGVKQRIGFDVIYVDVGGLSGSDGLLEALMLVEALEHGLEPRCLVIKSLCMRRLASTLTSFWRSHEMR